MGADSYLQFISILIIFVAVLGVTYYVTKWIANYQAGTESGKNIEVIETSKISATKYIQIVRIGEKYFALAVSKDQVSTIGEIDGDSLIREISPTPNMNFKDVLEKIKGEKKK